MRSRLSWGLALSLALLLGLQWLVVTRAIDWLTTQQLGTRLEQEAKSLLAAVAFDAQGALALDRQRMASAYQRPFSGNYYTIATREESLSSRSLWDESLAIPLLPPGDRRILRLAGPQDQPLLAVARGYRKQQREITIVVAENLEPLQTGMNRFQAIYGLASLIGLAALLFVQRRIVSGALAPLDQVRENMARLERGEVSQLEAHGPDEILPVLAEFNRLLSGMEQKNRRSREALGNLAHTLKTRLTLLNQIAASTELEALPNVRTAVYASTEAMQHAVERELKRARLMGDLRPGQRVDLHEVVDQLARTLRQLYVDKKVDIAWQAPPEANIQGDREDLLEMLGNLLDNACKWCRRRVTLTVSGLEDTRIVIEDDGPGCQQHALNALTRRGFRADESKPGSGLGLAIVHDIVDTYGGQLIFGKSDDLGGLRVEVVLPGKKSGGPN